MEIPTGIFIYDWSNLRKFDFVSFVHVVKIMIFSNRCRSSTLPEKRDVDLTLINLMEYTSPSWSPIWQPTLIILIIFAHEMSAVLNIAHQVLEWQY
jgi:hypothetical protein